MRTFSSITKLLWNAFHRVKNVVIHTACMALATAPHAKAVNYEVYPGSAFYLTQMLDRTQWSFVADHCSGLYHHPVGFSDLDTTQETTYTSHFSNRFAMVEGDMGSGSTTGDVANLQLMTTYGLTPVAAFVNRPSSNLSVWRQLVRNNAAQGAPSYEMLAPHRLDDTALGWNDPIWNYARNNMGIAGCIGSGVDAPVYLYVHQATAYRQSIYDMRDWTVANGKKFNYLLSPNDSYNAALLSDTQTTVRDLEDKGHEPDVYGVVLYGLRPVDLTPEKVTVNGVDQAATTITGLAYWLLKHRDGEAGTVDLRAIRNSTTYGGGVMSPILSNSSQIVALSSSASRTYTLRLNNNSPWLDYAGILRARAFGSTQNWTISFNKAGQDVTAAVLSANGLSFIGNDRWMPGVQSDLTMTVTPNGSPGPLKLVVEALPHSGVDHALDVLSFESGTPPNTAPTLALNTQTQTTREALPFGPLWFTCGDAETLSTALTVSATSSNTQLVPNANISFGQSSIQRWMRVVPATGQWGVATITVTVSDGTTSTTKSFNLTVERTTVLPIVKSNNVLNLESAASWQGAVVPGITEQAVWDATVTSANSTILNENIVVAGLRVTTPGGDVSIGGNAQLTLGISGVDLASSTRNLYLNAPLNIDESASWNIATNRLVRVTTGVGGIGGMTKSGSGRLELLGDDDFIGPLIANAGELVKTGAGSQSSTTVSGNAVLRISHTNGFGAGGLSITAANTSTGHVELSGGISVLAGKAVYLNSRSSGTDAVTSLSGENTFGGNVTLSTGGSLYGFSSVSGLLYLTGNFTSSASGNRNITLRGASDGQMTGTISDGSGVVGLIKTGSGTWTLAGTHAFTGAVSHQEGTLKITSPLPSQTLSVSQGATLTGSGTLGGSVTIAGIHSPGDDVGNQAITGALIYQGTASLRWELGGQTLTADKIEAGNVSIANGALIQVVTNRPDSTVSFSNGFWRVARQWPIITANSLSGSFALNTTVLDSLGKPSQPFGTFSLSQSASGVNLVWSPASDFQVWQYTYFGAQWNNPALAGPTQDPDGDGWTNNDEWVTGSVPNDSSSRFNVTFATNTLTFNRIAGRSYKIETSTNLTGVWTNFAIVPSGTGNISVPVSLGTGLRRFYRVKIDWNP